MHARKHTLALCAGLNKGMRKGVRNAVKHTDKTVQHYKLSYVELPVGIEEDCCFTLKRRHNERCRYPKNSFYDARWPLRRVWNSGSSLVITCVGKHTLTQTTHVIHLLTMQRGNSKLHLIPQCH